MNFNPVRGAIFSAPWKHIAGCTGLLFCVWCLIDLFSGAAHTFASIIRVVPIVIASVGILSNSARSARIGFALMAVERLLAALSLNTAIDSLVAGVPVEFYTFMYPGTTRAFMYDLIIVAVYAVLSRRCARRKSGTATAVVAFIAVLIHTNLMNSNFGSFGFTEHVGSTTALMISALANMIIAVATPLALPRSNKNTNRNANRNSNRSRQY